jgi:nicotinamide-nucleotide amidase
LLYQAGATLATAEWGTAGTLAGWLGDSAEPGVYVGGVVVSNWPTAVAALGLPAQAAMGSAASRETALEMAQACRQRFGTDYALAVAAFPGIASGDQPPERVHFAIAGPEGVRAESALFAGHPAILKPRAAKQALNLLRLHLLARLRSAAAGS